ncbi:MAG: hypothetical protein ACK4K3_07940 [Aquabacterium sp.]
MIGLAVFLVLVVYVFLAIKLFGFIKRIMGFNASALVAVFFTLVLLVLPFADEIVGRIQFDRACKKVEGYSVTSAIHSAQTAKYEDLPPPTTRIPGWIPIEKVTSMIVSVPDGQVLMQYDSLSTPGGWVMRGGVNLGNFSSCNNVNAAHIMEQNGFRLIEGGFFKRTGR